MRQKILIFASALAIAQAIAVSGLTGQTTAPAGPLNTPPDTTNGVLRRNALGLDFLVSNGGFGLGTFYRREYSDEFSAFIDFSVSEAKDDNEIQYYDWYGQSYTLGKVNRFLVMPLYLGVQKRLFKDEILDNFRPYLSAAAGPTIIYVFPEREEYFTAIGHGRPKFTAGGYIGMGAYFGSETSNLLGLSVRYYYIPYPKGIEGLEGVQKKDFGGFFITLNFGNAW